MDKQIVVYKTEDDIRLEVQTDGETVWLTQEQMCRLFGRTQSVIARHIANIFKEGELDRDSVYAKNAYTASDGKIYRNRHDAVSDLAATTISRRNHTGESSVVQPRTRA